ncbi:anaerobic typically selenocysteine-containing protein [Methylobacterium sp. NEAU 140]|uniref:anaerobic typically selenocysteine-containing protein n=1 Tax=Methylobacterium sp. NEAU 140 TaxID=3064945 RepID=UPI0027341808|nr:anaerobic typically selenocysteine-containing protein [Methylobacterium sp. NEAU 140]MDP4023050.1 anaerobic typically selenocysteine-containing protein [Methylobacterium sp. NEAU 140]
MRRTLLAACALAVPLLPAAALAEGKPLPPPASAVMPPVELTISMQDGKPVCAPQEIRLPADTNVALHVVSSADTPVTLTMPGQFANGRVLHADGDLVHVASEDGYLVKQNGKGTLRLRTLGPGQESYACTSTRDRKAPFTGTFVRTPPAG